MGFKDSEKGLNSFATTYHSGVASIFCARFLSLKKTDIPTVLQKRLNENRYSMCEIQLYRFYMSVEKDWCTEAVNMLKESAYAVFVEMPKRR